MLLKGLYVIVVKNNASIKNKIKTMSEENKNNEEAKSHWGEVFAALIGGTMKRFSVDLVLGAKERWDRFVLKIKSGLIAGVLIFLGLIFLMGGLAVYIGSLLPTVPGAGFLLTGIIFILAGLIASLIRKVY